MLRPQTPMVAFADTKAHYTLLDRLLKVEAITVVCFHLFESFATSHLDQRINHGYLSGFVAGYAYDNRWGTMTTKDFLLRRILRLHPMVVMGAVIGGAEHGIYDYASQTADYRRHKDNLRELSNGIHLPEERIYANVDWRQVLLPQTANAPIAPVVKLSLGDIESFTANTNYDRKNKAIIKRTRQET